MQPSHEVMCVSESAPSWDEMDRAMSYIEEMDEVGFEVWEARIPSAVFAASGKLAEVKFRVCFDRTCAWTLCFTRP